MAKVILLVLLASGIYTESPPKKHQRGSSYSSVWTNPDTKESNKNDRKPSNGNDSDVGKDQRILKIYENDNEYISAHLPDIVKDQRSKKYNRGTVCEMPFVAVGENCYYFSEERKSFEEAEEYCISIGFDLSYQTSLAMLDYSESEDQALLDIITTKDKKYWIGGKTQDGFAWKWVDGRDIFLQSPYWYYAEPNESENHQCAVAQVNSWTDQRERSYLFDHNCTKSLHFVCESRCPSNFRLIDGHCYFLSEDTDYGDVTWQDARDFCQSLSAPVGHHSDLAVLGLQTQDSYHLILDIFTGFTSSIIWLGAFAHSECNFVWVDGRNLSLTSLYWGIDWPICCDTCDSASLFYNDVINKSWMIDTPGSSHYPFACQIFKDQ